MHLHLRPAVLTDDEWALIECEFEKGSPFLVGLKKLRRARNKPMKASEVLPPRFVHSGHEKVNAVMRDGKLLFRLTRVGPLTRGPRDERMLAIVRVSKAHQKSLKNQGKK